jgi:hypothetical protein
MLNPVPVVTAAAGAPCAPVLFSFLALGYRFCSSVGAWPYGYSSFGVRYGLFGFGDETPSN